MSRPVTGSSHDASDELAGADDDSDVPAAALPAPSVRLPEPPFRNSVPLWLRKFDQLCVWAREAARFPSNPTPLPALRGRERATAAAAARQPAPARAAA